VVTNCSHLKDNVFKKNEHIYQSLGVSLQSTEHKKNCEIRLKPV